MTFEKVTIYFWPETWTYETAKKNSNVNDPNLCPPSPCLVAYFLIFMSLYIFQRQCTAVQTLHESNTWWCLWKYLWSLCADGEMWWWHRLAGPGHDVWWLLSMTSPAHSLPTDDIIQTSHATRPLPPSLTALRNMRHGQCHKSFKCRLYEGSRRFQNNREGPSAY